MSSFMSVDFYKATWARHTCTETKQTTLVLVVNTLNTSTSCQFELMRDDSWFPLKCTWFYAHTQYVKVLLQNKNIIKIVCALLSGVKILFHPLISEGLISLSKRQCVSEWVCVCVWMFPNSSETANPSDLKFWGMIPLGIGKVLG